MTTPSIRTRFARAVGTHSCATPAPSIARIAASALLLALLCVGMQRAQAAPPSMVLDATLARELAALPAVSGPQVELRALRGKPVVVSFFASWCPACRTEFAQLNHLIRTYPGAITVLAINVLEAFDAQDGPRMAHFLDETTPEFPVLEGSDSVNERFGGVAHIPTVVVFDGAGLPVLHFVAQPDAPQQNPTLAELIRAVDTGLGRTPGPVPSGGVTR